MDDNSGSGGSEKDAGHPTPKENEPKGDTKADASGAKDEQRSPSGTDGGEGSVNPLAPPINIGAGS